MNSEIKYINAFNQPRNQYKTITHENLDKRSAEWFTQGFAEMIPNSGLRRLYFDVELDEYKEGYLSDVISWLNNVAGVLNTTYAACGYTIDNNFISEYEEDEEINSKLMLDFKSDESLHHAISFHVIFNKVFDAKDLYEVLNKPEYIFVKDGVDMSVYKDANKQQLLRHAFATKIKSCKDIVHTEIDFENFENQLYKASELVVTPNGNESVGTIEELKEAFCYDESKKIINNLAINSISKRCNNIELVNSKTSTSTDLKDDVETLLSNVCLTFDYKASLHDIVAFIPSSKNEYVNLQFLEVYNNLYNSVEHKSADDIISIYEKLDNINGFCSCMSNIKNAYYKIHNYNELKNVRKAAKNEKKKDKLTQHEKDELNNYVKFSAAYHRVINYYFDNYDYVHTTANAKKFLNKCNDKSKVVMKQYKRLYIRKILYMTMEKYLYRTDLYNTSVKSLDNGSFKIYLKRLFNLSSIDDAFNNNLKVFHEEDMLETDDGLVYPRYRDLNFNECLTDDEFKKFETAYKATFKDECCAEFAFKLLIQDIASGFHDNAGIIKFYYGKGGNNKDCETCVYENIIGGDNLVFKTHKYDILADEKNKSIVESLYVQFNEMPATNKERFDEFVNALKNYNECGKQRTRGFFQDFITINCNIRFQCNTNHPILRDWLLDGANDAIKRRFFVAERIHSDEYSSWLWEFSHDVNKCKALKMYIKMHKDELYTDKLNSIKMLQFYIDNDEIYAKYTEAKANDEFEELKEALCNSACIKGKRTLSGEDEYIVNVKQWYKCYVTDNRIKMSENAFRSMINKYTSYEKNAYIDGKRVSGKYFISDEQMIKALGEHEVNIDVSADESVNIEC